MLYANNTPETAELEISLAKDTGDPFVLTL